MYQSSGHPPVQSGQAARVKERLDSSGRFPGLGKTFCRDATDRHVGGHLLLPRLDDNWRQPQLPNSIQDKVPYGH
jgi:hypothetical protein